MSDGEDATPVVIPRGRPKSGRLWKSERLDRHSELGRDKAMKTSWAKKMEQKALNKAIKLHENELKAAKAKEKQDKRDRTLLNKQRRLENEKKNEIVQKVKNKAKLRRMRKKQLRKISKKKK